MLLPQTPGTRNYSEISISPGGLPAARRLPGGPLVCPCIILRQVGPGKTTANNTIKSIIRERHMHRFSVITISACAALLLVTRRSCTTAARGTGIATAATASLRGADHTRTSKGSVAAAEAEMKKNGWNHGHRCGRTVVEILLHLQKPISLAIASVDIAQDKARTSAPFRVPTKSTRIGSRTAKPSYSVSWDDACRGRHAHCCRWQTYWRHRSKRRDATAGPSVAQAGCERL